MKTKEYERERSRRRRAKDREKINALARARHAIRMAADPAYRATKAANATKWVRANPHKAVANVVRRDAQKLRATPVWADHLRIKQIYGVAEALRQNGEPCHVDHIVPLRSPFVCGLHVHYNLELATPERNRIKGNREWPDRA